MSKLWIVSELFYPEMTSTGYIVTRIAAGLAQAGHDVNVICARPGYSSKGAKVASREKWQGMNIYRPPSTNFDKDKLILRMINVITISISLFFSAIFHFARNHLVMVVTNPPSLPFIVAAACRLRRAKCVLLIHDLYPEVIIAAGEMGPSSPFVSILNRLNRMLFRRIHHIVVIGWDMMALVKKKTSPYKTPISVISNWSDLDLIEPLSRSKNRLLHELGLQNKFVLQYAGNMGYPHDIEIIVEAAAKLSHRQEFHFIFIGSGVKRRWLEIEIFRRQLKNVSILPARPREDQPNFLNACDIALISLKAGMRGVSVPSRTYNILAAGKPMILIGEADSDVGCLIMGENIGWVVQPGNSSQLVEVILAAFTNLEKLKMMGEKGRQVAEEKYSFDTVLNSYHQLFQTLSRKT